MVENYRFLFKSITFVHMYVYIHIWDNFCACVTWRSERFFFRFKIPVETSIHSREQSKMRKRRGERGVKWRLRGRPVAPFSFLLFFFFVFQHSLSFSLTVHTHLYIYIFFIFSPFSLFFAQPGYEQKKKKPSWRRPLTFLPLPRWVTF